MKTRRLQEHDFQNALLIEITADRRVMATRINSGRFKNEFGGWVKGAPPGTADILGTADPGIAFAIECKVLPENLNAAQERWRDRFLSIGGLHVVASADPNSTPEDAAKIWARVVAARIDEARAARKLVP